METFKEIVTSSVFGIVIAAFVTVLFNYLNSRAQRKVELKKVYFEKAYCAFEDFQEFISNRILFYNTHAAQAETILKINQLEKITEDFILIVESINTATAKYQTDSRKALKLELFIDVDSCEPDQFTLKIDDFNNLMHEVKVISELHGAKKLDHSLVNDFMNRMNEKGKQVEKAYLDFGKNVQNKFRDKFNF